MDRAPGEGVSCERKTVLLQRNALKYLRGPDGKEEVCVIGNAKGAMPLHLDESRQTSFCHVQDFPPIVEESMEKLSPGEQVRLLTGLSLQDVTVCMGNQAFCDVHAPLGEPPQEAHANQFEHPRKAYTLS